MNRNYRKKTLLTILIVIVIAILGIFIWSRYNQDNDTTEKKAPHFESSTPEANSTLPASPPNITIDFNFDLASGSSIEILKDGKNYASGDTIIDDNKLAMRQNMDANVPDGVYVIEYNACWPDGSCHDGRLSFTIDRSLQAEYQDLTGQEEVTIHMSQIMFEPMNIKISQGTKVTWVNDDDTIHYVNTDAHPSHTHILNFNSEALELDDEYSYTFEKAGAYPYHCSAHAATMVGAIVVE